MDQCIAAINILANERLNITNSTSSSNNNNDRVKKLFNHFGPVSSGLPFFHFVLFFRSWCCCWWWCCCLLRSYSLFGNYPHFVHSIENHTIRCSIIGNVCYAVKCSFELDIEHDNYITTFAMNQLTNNIQHNIAAVRRRQRRRWGRHFFNKYQQIDVIVWFVVIALFDWIASGSVRSDDIRHRFWYRIWCDRLNGQTVKFGECARRRWVAIAHSNF